MYPTGNEEEECVCVRVRACVSICSWKEYAIQISQ